MEHKSAIILAKKLFTGFKQEFVSLYDLPCAVNLGDFIAQARPMLYYKANEGDDWDSCLYCVFFYQDTKGPHRYDFTGWLRAVGKHVGEPPVVIARSHWEFTLIDDDLVYSAGDHNPCDISEVKRRGSNIINYNDVDFCNMEDPRFQRWARSDKSIFGDAVTAPWQWSDPVIKKAGLIWREPAQFIELALKAHEKGVL